MNLEISHDTVSIVTDDERTIASTTIEKLVDGHLVYVATDMAGTDGTDVSYWHCDERTQERELDHLAQLWAKDHGYTNLNIVHT